MNKYVQSRSMSTQQIKKGLQNIKKAQLQVLKQLKGDSFLLQKGQNVFSQKVTNIKRIQNNQNIYMNANMIQKSNLSTKNQRNNNKYSSQSTRKTNESLSSNSSSTHLQIQQIKKQFTSQRQQMNHKLLQITNKLKQLQKQKQKSSKPQQQNEFKSIIKSLQQQNKHLLNEKRNLDNKLYELQTQNKKLKSQLDLKIKQKIIIQTQMKSLKSQNNKLLRINKDQQYQIKQQSIIIKETRQYRHANISQQPTIQGSNNKLNLQYLINQIKTISQSHQYLFNKLKQSSNKLQMQSLQKQSTIQTSFSKVLEYLQSVSINSTSAGYIFNNQDNNNQFFNNNKKSNNYIKRSFISDSRQQQRDQFQKFVQQIKDGQNMSFAIVKRQMEQLKQQNQILRKKIKQLTKELTITFNGEYNSPMNKNNRKISQSNRFFSMELQDMRQQITKLKKHKQQIKLEQQDQQKQLTRYRIKCKQLQHKLQTQQYKLLQANNQKFSYQKRTQQQQLQIMSLNSIIKDMNNKLSPSGSGDLQTSALGQLRQQFTKLLQTNSLLMRQKQSIRAMNQGLQVQVHNLKYQKQQFQSNNKQKHDLIQRQIKQRNNLLQQITKKDIKIKEIKDELQKLRNSITLNDEQSLKMRKHFEDLLQQKNQQVLQLRKQIQQLYVQSRQSHQLRFRHEKLQAQFKQLSRKSMKMGQTLTHLWSVKQAQYFNIHNILGLLRNPQQNRNSQEH